MPSYWKREPELFRDGVLDQKHVGFVPPKCYGVMEPDASTAWIWTEEIVDVYGRDWPLERFGVAAKHLGQFNGRYLVGEPVPDHPSFCPNWLRTQMALQRERGQVFPPPEVWDEPAVRAFIPPTAVERLARLWAEQDAFLDVLDRLPRTFCHRDAFRNNLIARRTESGQEETVAIDWALTGPGHLGEDLYKFVTITQLFLRTDSKPSELDAVAFEGYLAGLREVGWNEDARIVRLGYAATTVMGSAARVLVQLLRNPDFAALAERVSGKPLEEVRARWVEGAYYRLGLADEARDLMEWFDSSQ